MELRVLSFLADGRIPSASTEDTLKRAVDWGLDIIVAQGTGMDPGPHWLGSGQPYNLEAFKANVTPYLKISQDQKIPFIFSVGTAGTDRQVEASLEKINEICKEEGLKFRIATISGQIDKKYLKSKIENGTKIKRIIETPWLKEYLTFIDVDEASNIVGQMGPEPIMKALEKKVDGVITGRALDSGLFMAAPLLRGIHVSVAAHAAKVLECASFAATPGTPAEALYGVIRNDHFIVKPPNPTMKCTIASVFGHSMYERRDPFREENPGGYLDLSKVEFEQLDAVTVKAYGAQWVPTAYSVKIEGAKKVGYRTLFISGIREESLISQIDDYLATISGQMKETSPYATLDHENDYKITFRVYGKNAVLGELEPIQTTKSHELGLIVDVVAKTQELANSIAGYFWSRIFVSPFKGRKTTAGNVAVPFSPPIVSAGEVYSFNVWHLLPLDDPLEPFKMRISDFPA